MNEKEIKRLIRGGIREPKPVRVDDDDLDASITEAISFLGQRILAAEPEYFKKRVSLTSYTNIFTPPSDCDRILGIWDMGDNAETISGAADNGSGAIRLTTSAAHGWDDGDIITVHDVGGCTEANGTWAVEDAPTTTTIDLEGSTYTNAYDSGGKVFKEEESFEPIVRIPSKEATGLNTYKWYLFNKVSSQDNGYIVIDDPDYTYDIIINYRYVASTIAEIPAKFHQAIVSYGVRDLIMVPPNTDSKYQDLQNQYKRHTEMFNYYMSMIEDFKVSKEPSGLSDVKRVKRRI